MGESENKNMKEKIKEFVANAREDLENSALEYGFNDTRVKRKLAEWYVLDILWCELFPEEDY